MSVEGETYQSMFSYIYDLMYEITTPSHSNLFVHPWLQCLAQGWTPI